MILAGGRIRNPEEIDEIINTLEKRVCNTLQKPLLSPMTVINACQKLSERIEAGDFDEVIGILTAEANITEEQVAMVVRLLKRESLLYKLDTELGEGYSDTIAYTPMFQKNTVRKRYLPLGVLFHIAAGNIDGLPAYSVIEGLLAGNINIVKLPAADKGFTVRLLLELIRIEPELAEYIYVFDTSSNDVIRMKKMARSADGIVVWGGDTAISAVRKLATPNTRIIEWGHKISFAYVTEKGMEDEELIGLAHHILTTRQLLCSSCQGIFIDTDRLQAVEDFSRRFLALLEEAAKEYPEPDIGMQAQLTLLLYNQELEPTQEMKRIYRGKRCSVAMIRDKKLEVSLTCGNCWTRQLPRTDIIKYLHRYKGYLQTVGLLCAAEEREELSTLLCRAGATRITAGSEMSRMLCGENHDGDYPLRRYTKVVEF